MVENCPPTLIVAAPASGSGKTTITLALLRAFRKAGVSVSSFKVGPDYIDPAFHAAATGRPCYNLDPWAMDPVALAKNASKAGGAELVIGEGVMGLFDGAPDGTGSTADLAALMAVPVLLVIDVRGQGASAAAVVRGFTTHRPDLQVAGVIFNRVGGPGHVRVLAQACRELGITPLGYVPRYAELALPDRHLGLVQAGEHGDLEGFLDFAAAYVAEHVDLAALRALAAPDSLPPGEASALPPLGQNIAVARDQAFAFAYPHMLEGWREAGATLSFFSPLTDEPPAANADAVFLPGGYPELHGARLAGSQIFLEGLRHAASSNAAIYGECGGYMVLGQGLIDAEGRRHAMAGILPVETSFADRKLHLGYRQAELTGDGPLGAAGGAFRAHEFHYASTMDGPKGEALFHCRDSLGNDLGAYGCRVGSVGGSFIHLIGTAW